MKILVLLALAFGVLALTVASVVTYRTWTTDRYDDLIRQAASDYSLRFEVVKAFIRQRSGFDPMTATLEGRGLMLVPQTAVREYYEAHGLDGPMLVCLNRRFANHAAVKDERYDPRSGIRACPVKRCQAALVEEIMDPPVNIQVGCWYLAQLRDRIAAAIHPRTEDTLPWALLAYLTGYDALNQRTQGFQTELTPDMKEFLAPIYGRAEGYKER